MYNDMIARQFHLLHENSTLCVATMVDPRLKKCGFANAEPRAAAEFLLRKQVNELQFVGSRYQPPNPAVEPQPSTSSVLDVILKPT